MKYSFFLVFFIVLNLGAQQVENASSLDAFSQKLKSNKSVTNVLFLGDSHIQAGWIPEVLRMHFQSTYGNAGRGLVFPFSLANSNGPSDLISASSSAWQTFRLSYEQDVFPELGALGYVMGNQEESFIEISCKNPDDAFDEVKIFHSPQMNGEPFEIFTTNQNLKDFVQMKKTLQKYTAESGDTYPEIAAKFNVVTTRLAQLNGDKIKKPQAGQTYTLEKAEPIYNPEFEKSLHLVGKAKFSDDETVFQYPHPVQKFLLKTESQKGNTFYGFQFLKKEAKSGVVLNAVGVNGATYADFLKFPIQLQQLKSTQPDLVIIALGTNEALSSVTKEDFIQNITKLVSELRKDQSNLPILLISPTDNNLNANKTAQIVSWIQEASTTLDTAFFNLYNATGGRGYFSKAKAQKKASADNVHFQAFGYQEQGEIIWKVLQKLLQKD